MVKFKYVFNREKAKENITEVRRILKESKFDYYKITSNKFTGNIIVASNEKYRSEEFLLERSKFNSLKFNQPLKEILFFISQEELNEALE